jgi:hypothetical protein
MGDFGVAVSPFELDEWITATGISPDLCMIFEAWSRQRALTDVCAKARRLGHSQLAVTWEPWTPVPVGTDPAAQGQPQPEWAPATILAGDHDDYIDAVARSIRDSGLTAVWIRYGHEMNGGWYPWSADTAGYVAAWKYIRHRMRSVRAAWNARFVWAPNPDLWRATPADWLVRLMPYWPGPAAVDALGATMIEFGRDDRSYAVTQFAERFDLAHRIFGRPVRAMEVNVAQELAVPWLCALARHAAANDLPAVILSQGASRAAAVGGTGDLDWSLMDDPDARAAVRALVDALHS